MGLPDLMQVQGRSEEGSERTVFAQGPSQDHSTMIFQSINM